MLSMDLIFFAEDRLNMLQDFKTPILVKIVMLNNTKSGTFTNFE